MCGHFLTENNSINQVQLFWLVPSGVYHAVSALVSVSGFSKPCRAHVQLHACVRVHVEREPLRWVEEESAPLIQNVHITRRSLLLRRARASSEHPCQDVLGLGNEGLAAVRKPAAGIWTPALLLTRQPAASRLCCESIGPYGFLGWSRVEWEAAWVEAGRLTGEKVSWLPSTLTDFPPPSLPLSLPSLSLAHPSHQPHKRGEMSPLLLLCFPPLLCLSSHHLLLF